MSTDAGGLSVIEDYDLIRVHYRAGALRDNEDRCVFKGAESFSQRRVSGEIESGGAVIEDKDLR